MKTYIPIILLLAVCTIIFLGMPESLIAQPPPPPSKPTQTPIDGGLGLLAAAGGAYAYRKLRKKNK